MAWPASGSRPARPAALAGGDAQLPFHQVEPGDHLGDRMLDLEPGVHLQEVESRRHRRRTRPCRRRRSRRPAPRRTAASPMRRGAPASQAGGGRFLDHLLVAPLRPSSRARRDGRRCRAQSANTCTSMWRGRCRVALDQHAVVAEGDARLLLGAASAAAKSSAAVDDPHAAPAAAGHRLDQHRKADARRPGRRARRRPGRRRDSPAPPARRPAPSALGRAILSPIARIAAGGGPTKISPAAAHGFGEGGILRQEAVAGMDRVGAARCAAAMMRVDVQIAVARRRRADRARPRRPSRTCRASASASE